MASSELIPQSAPLDSVPGLAPGQIEKLEAIWCSSAQELIALAQTPKVTRDLVASMLGVDNLGLQRVTEAALSVVPRTRAGRGSRVEIEAMTTVYGLGALLAEPPAEIARRLRLPSYRPKRGRPSLPAAVSLLDQLPQLRRQGSRGTCVAFAVLTVRELLEIAAGSPQSLDLSEQFVYWWCKAHDGMPTTPGTYVSQGMHCLRELGAPLEDVWPYAWAERETEGQGPPPPEAAIGNPAYRVNRILEFNRNDTDGIKACLAEGRAIAFSVPVFPSWYYSSATRRWGKITLPLPGEAQDGGHAMTLVGYQDDPGAPGGGYFLVRNSWQPWSYDGVWRPGYGYMPYGYINRYTTALYSAERVSDGLAFMRDAFDDAGQGPQPRMVWNSPDLWLRRQADGQTDHQLPAPGVPSAVYVRIHNHGSANVYGMKADLFAAPLAPDVARGAWRHVGRMLIPVLPPGTTTPAPFTLDAGDGCPQALMVSLSSRDDPPVNQPGESSSALMAHRHCWPVSLVPGSTAEFVFDINRSAGTLNAERFRFEVGAPADLLVVSPIQLEPRPGDLGANPSSCGQAGTNGRSVVEEAVLGATTGGLLGVSDQRWWARFTVALAEHARPGYELECAIVQNDGSQDIGRMTVQVRVVSE